MGSIRRKYRYWLSPNTGYPKPNEENVKMLVDGLRQLYLEQEPLTIDELNNLYANLENKTILNLCRAIEKAHGIMEVEDVRHHDVGKGRYYI